MRYIFCRVSTEMPSFPFSLVTSPYLSVSTALLSAPSEPSVQPTVSMHRRAVSARIESSQSGGMVCRCLAMVVWSGTGSFHGILRTSSHFSTPR